MLRLHLVKWKFTLSGRATCCFLVFDLLVSSSVRLSWVFLGFLAKAIRGAASGPIGMRRRPRRIFKEPRKLLKGVMSWPNIQVGGLDIVKPISLISRDSQCLCLQCSLRRAVWVIQFILFGSIEQILGLIWNPTFNLSKLRSGSVRRSWSSGLFEQPLSDAFESPTATVKHRFQKRVKHEARIFATRSTMLMIEVKDYSSSDCCAVVLSCHHHSCLYSVYLDKKWERAIHTNRLLPFNFQQHGFWEKSFFSSDYCSFLWIQVGDFPPLATGAVHNITNQQEYHMSHLISKPHICPRQLQGEEETITFPSGTLSPKPFLQNWKVFSRNEPKHNTARFICNIIALIIWRNP